MSNNADYICSRFQMKAEDMPKAYKKLMKVAKDLWPWGNDPTEMLASKTLIELLEHFHFILQVYRGSVNGIEFAGVSAHPEFEDVLSAIAPFVRAGSWIMITTDYSGLCAYYFNGTKCEIIYGDVNFGEEYKKSFFEFNHGPAASTAGDVDW